METDGETRKNDFDKEEIVTWTCKSSGQTIADAIIIATPCLLVAVQIKTDGTNDATATIYDNASEASGKILADIKVKGGDEYGGRIWAYPVECDNGIYLDLTGTGANAIVEYILGHHI